MKAFQWNATDYARNATAQRGWATELREAFIDQVIAHYLAAHPPDEDGTTAVAMVRLEVEAIARHTG
ncbi:MAG: hypothetical protein R6X15_08995 [Pseudomonadota bacterium]